MNGKIGHGNDVVITIEDSAVYRRYLGGGFVNKSIFGIYAYGKDQESVLSELSDCADAAAAYSGNGIISSKISVTGGSVSANGTWKYGCRLTALVRYP